MNPRDYFKTFSISLVMVWLTVFVLFGWILVLIASLMSHSNDNLVELPLTLNNFQQFINPVYWQVFQRSFIIAGLCTLLCLIIGYPFAYLLSRTKSSMKGILLLLLIIPFWTSSLIRGYAMIAILKTKGILNSLLLALGIIDAPLQLLFTNTALVIGLVYSLLPFMIFPIYANLERLNPQLIEAAKDLGANYFTTFTRIIFPLSMPGVSAGCMLCFLPGMTLFFLSDLLGGAKSMLLGNLIQFQFLTTLDWPLGAATSVMLSFIMGLMILVYLFHDKRKHSLEEFA